MNIFLNEYFGFCFELNFELNHFLARFNEKMNFQNVSYRANFSTKKEKPCSAIKKHFFNWNSGWLHLVFDSGTENQDIMYE